MAGLVLLAIAGTACSAVEHSYIVPSDSMANTIHAGDHVATDGDALPTVGSIVIFTGPPNWPNEGLRSQPSKFIKRVIAVGGDTVACRHDQLTVNGVAKPEPYVFPGAHECSGDGFEGRTVHVPAGAIFVMGDNRDESLDSRTNGAVPVADVVGVVTKITLPTSHATDFSTTGQ